MDREGVLPARFRVPARLCSTLFFFFPASDLVQYLVYPKQPGDFCLVRLSDGDFYVTAKLTVRAIGLLAEQDLSATQIKGACVSLRKFDKVTSPSKLEMQLVCDDVMHLGADGSTPFYNPKDVNQAPALRAALEEAKNGDDYMLLMAEVVDQDQPSRTAYGNFPFSVSDAVIPPAQRKRLKSLAGWTTMEQNGDSPSEPEQEYFQEGVGTQMPVGGGGGGHSSSSQPSVNDDGVYVIVDGVHQKLPAASSPQKAVAMASSPQKPVAVSPQKPPAAASPNSGPKRTAAPPSPSLSLSYSEPKESPAVAAGSAVVPVQQNVPQQISQQVSQGMPAPVSQNGFAPSLSLSFGDVGDDAAGGTGTNVSPKRSPAKQVPAGSPQPHSPQPCGQPSPVYSAAVDISDEELPMFQGRNAPQEGGSADFAVASAPEKQVEWPPETLKAVCDAIQLFGADWDAVSASVASTGGPLLAPIKIEKFFRDYHTFVPNLKTALEVFESSEPLQKRQKSDDKAAAAEDEVFEVECILDERVGDDGKEFFVKWKGWSIADASWVDEESFVNCDALMQQWRAEQAKQASVSNKAPPVVQEYDDVDVVVMVDELEEEPVRAQPPRPEPEFKTPTPKGRVVARRVEFDEFGISDSPPREASLSASKRGRGSLGSAPKPRWRPSIVVPKKKAETKSPKRASRVNNRSMSDTSLSSRLAAKVLESKMLAKEL